QLLLHLFVNGPDWCNIHLAARMGRRQPTQDLVPGRFFFSVCIAAEAQRLFSILMSIATCAAADAIPPSGSNRAATAERLGVRFFICCRSDPTSFKNSSRSD